ncbi:MAG: hypothetical protein PHE15_07360 [Dehalococcoidales bacterium]|nr:hypothetical protein [Dehalococcoidales bacterium]
MDLITTNVYSKRLSNHLLICGSCIPQEWPEAVDKLGNNCTILTTCPEAVHMNTIIAKVASMLAKSTITEIDILTKDGSPHCIGLHFSIEWAVKMMKASNVTVRYFVLEHGSLHEISPQKIVEKRHLSK